MYVKINGTEYKALHDFSISEQTGNKTSSDISVLVEEQPVPVAGDVIEMFDDNDNRLFWGTCGIPTSPKYETGYEPKIYEITCGNANSILANRIINAAFQKITVSDLVRSIYDTYIAAEGVSLGTISNIDVTIEVYTAADMNLQDALNEIADLVGAIWQIDQSKTFSFVVFDDFPQFPQKITPSFLLGTELEHQTKDYNLRTVQYVSGATDVTDTQTESFTYDGEEKTFTTVFPLNSAPSIWINNNPVPANQIAPDGLETETTVFTFTYNSPNIKYIGENELTAGDIVKVAYIGIFPIRISVSNALKINEIATKTGTSGLIEKVQLANNITNFADAYQLASALLSQFEEARGEITWWMTSEQLYKLGLTLNDTDLLTKITFDLSNIGIVGEFVITERTLEPFFGDLSQDVEQKLKISLKLVNRDYVKSYGEIISDLRRDINQLSIRAEDTVVNAQQLNEIYALSEQIASDVNNAYFPVSGDNVGLFAPLEIINVYPV